MNCIIVHKFDFSDEEVMAYYISFLKTMSLKLNVHTIHFFFNEVTNNSRNFSMQPFLTNFFSAYKWFPPVHWSHKIFQPLWKYGTNCCQDSHVECLQGIRMVATYHCFSFIVHLFWFLRLVMNPCWDSYETGLLLLIFPI